MSNGDGVKSLVVAGLSGGSGKSVVSVGLTGAIAAQKGQVAVFKKGPDYIDAGWLSQAAGRPCYNLDPYLMSVESIRSSFLSHLSGCSHAIIEGNRGLYDGVTADGCFSTAELAQQLDLPLLLVVNCSKTTRTVAAMVLGCRELDPRVRIAGVILNQIATPRHETIIRQAVEQSTGIPVLGIVPRMKENVFPMRHLGMIPHQEYDSPDGTMNRLTRLARDNFDLNAIEAIMDTVSVRTAGKPLAVVRSEKKVKIGVLRDVAFQFYYEENFEALEEQGAELVMVDALTDLGLPSDIDGLYIGGGFPETSAAQLADNVRFRKSVRDAAERGLPIYAECGGLIYLGKSIRVQGQEFPLAGVFPVSFSMSRRPQAHGYSTFTVEAENSIYPVGTQVNGHEFRYSVVENWQDDSSQLVLKMDRGTGFMDGRDGLVKKNILAMYTHVLAPGSPSWAPGLIRACKKYAAGGSGF